MTSDAPPQSPAARRPTRAQRLVVLTFFIAFGFTILTVLFTALAVKARRSHDSADAPAAAAPEPPRAP